MKTIPCLLVSLSVLTLAFVAQAAAPAVPASASAVIVTPVADPVTYTCTATSGEIQYQDRNGNWQTLMTVQKGHVFVTNTANEGNFRFLPEEGWTRKVG